MSIKCEICNKEFKLFQGLSHHLKSAHNIITEEEKKEYYDTYLKADNEGLCKTCSNPTSYMGFGKGYRTYCSHSCVFLNEESLQKYKNTMNDKYGFEHYFQNDETQQKVHKTRREIDSYSKHSSFSNPEVIQHLSKIRNEKITNFEKENNCTQYKKINDKYSSTVWKKLNLPKIKIGEDCFIENKYLPVIDEFMTTYHNQRKITSIAEKSIVAFIKSFYQGEIVENNRTIIKPKELDIYLPDLRLAIEYNGTWFHSTECNTPKNYHYKKSLKCKEKGIRLIHIYEFEDFEQQKQLLKDLILGIDNYPKNDYNKNNLLDGFDLIKPFLVENSNLHIYTVGKLL